MDTKHSLGNPPSIAHLPEPLDLLHSNAKRPGHFSRGVCALFSLFKAASACFTASAV
jgi:hypothetical protein